MFCRHYVPDKRPFPGPSWKGNIARMCLQMCLKPAEKHPSTGTKSINITKT